MRTCAASDITVARYRSRIWRLLTAACLILAVLLLSAGCEGSASAPVTVARNSKTTDLAQVAKEQQLGKRIGFTVGDHLATMSEQELEESLADMESLGVGWLRFDMAWDIAQPEQGDTFEWARSDRIVLAARKHNLKVLPILTFTPKWARQPECIDTFKCAPVDNADFARFAAEAARHYAPMGVQTWEIWTEPNTTFFWRPLPNAEVYVDLLKKSYTAIKQVDPQATVISAGLSPAENKKGSITQLDYFESMYRYGAKDYMDAVGYHPYSYPSLPGNVLEWSAWSQMSDLDRSIRSIMSDNGDGDKQVWVTEFGAPTNGPLNFADEYLQNYMIEDAIRQMSETPWMATLFFHSYKDLGTEQNNIENFFGVVRYDGTKKPSYYKLKSILAGP